MYHGVWVHSFADGHLGCFQYLAMVNCAAMNIGVHRFFWIGVSGILCSREKQGAYTLWNGMDGTGEHYAK